MFEICVVCLLAISNFPVGGENDFIFKGLKRMLIVDDGYTSYLHTTMP